MHARTLLLSAALCLAQAAPCQKRLTTLFATNNGLSAGMIVFFDVDVKSPTGVAITALETNTSDTTTFDIDIYVTPTTYVGKDATASAWTLVRTGLGLGIGQNQPSVVTFAPPLPLATGKWGIGLHHKTAFCRYTDGNVNNQSYSNADLGLTLGLSRSALWGGSVFSPRVWNGTIIYDTTANPPSFVTWGAGCAGSNGVPRMNGGNAPKLGGLLRLDYTGMPLTSGVVMAIVGVSRTTWSGLTLPFSLAAINMPGCTLYTSVDLTYPGVISSGGTGFAILSLPPDPWLLGQELFMQTFVPDSLATAFPARMTNAAHVVIGQ